MKEQTQTTERSSRVLPWVTVGTGVALGFAALGLELDRRDAVQDARSAGSRSNFEDNVDRMQRDQTLARVFGTVGLTGLVVGVVWLLLPDAPSESPDEHLGYACSSVGCNVGVRF